MRELTFDEICFICMIDEDFKNELSFYYNKLIYGTDEQRFIRSLGFFQDTEIYYERLQNYKISAGMA